MKAEYPRYVNPRVGSGTRCSHSAVQHVVPRLHRIAPISEGNRSIILAHTTQSAAGNKPAGGILFGEISDKYPGSQGEPDAEEQGLRI